MVVKNPDTLISERISVSPDIYSWKVGKLDHNQVSNEDLFQAGIANLFEALFDEIPSPDVNPRPITKFNPPEIVEVYQSPSELKDSEELYMQGIKTMFDNIGFIPSPNPIRVTSNPKWSEENDPMRLPSQENKPLKQDTLKIITERAANRMPSPKPQIVELATVSRDIQLDHRRMDLADEELIRDEAEMYSVLLDEFRQERRRFMGKAFDWVACRFFPKRQAKMEASMFKKHLERNVSLDTPGRKFVIDDMMRIFRNA